LSPRAERKDSGLEPLAQSTIQKRKNSFSYYRLRKPVGEGRGWVCYISRSRDGVKFKRVWSARREEFDSPSIERSALVKTPQDTFRLYVSYVDGENRRWRIDVLEAED